MFAHRLVSWQSANGMRSGQTWEMRNRKRCMNYVGQSLEYRQVKVSFSTLIYESLWRFFLFSNKEALLGSVIGQWEAKKQAAFVSHRFMTQSNSNQLTLYSWTWLTEARYKIILPCVNWKEKVVNVKIHLNNWQIPKTNVKTDFKEI